jgi:hypothetical protein
MNTLDKTKLYLDEEGYDELFDEIGSLRNDLDDVARENVGSDAIGGATNSSADIVRTGELGKEANIKAEKERKLRSLLNVIPIKEHGIEDLVDINDEVRLRLKHSDGRVNDGVTYTLVARRPRSFKEVSINSNLGNKIYKAAIGEENLEYDTIRGNTTTHTTVEVLDIIRKIKGDIPKSLG